MFWVSFSYDAMDTPVNKIVLFVFLKASQCLCFITDQSQCSLDESINSVVRGPKNGTSCMSQKTEGLFCKRFLETVMNNHPINHNEVKRKVIELKYQQKNPRVRLCNKHIIKGDIIGEICTLRVVISTIHFNPSQILKVFFIKLTNHTINKISHNLWHIN